MDEPSIVNDKVKNSIKSFYNLQIYIFIFQNFLFQGLTYEIKKIKKQLRKCPVNGKFNQKTYSKQLFCTHETFLYFKVFDISWTNMLDLIKKEFLVTYIFNISCTNLDYSIKKYVYAFFLLQKDFDTFHEPFFRDLPYFSVNIQFKFFIYRLIQSNWFKILEELVLFLYLSMQLDNGKWHTRVVMFYSLKPLLETKSKN